MQIIPVAIGQQLNASGVKDVAWMLYPFAAVAMATGCTLLIRSTTSGRHRLAWALIVASLAIVTIALSTSMDGQGKVWLTQTANAVSSDTFLGWMAGHWELAKPGWENQANRLNCLLGAQVTIGCL